MRLVRRLIELISNHFTRDNTLSNHIAHLAAANRVKVIMDPTTKDSSSILKHEIYVRSPVNDDITYAIALHELGHILSPNQAYCEDYNLVHLFGPTDKIKGLEIDAWTWARKTALQWTPAMESIAKISLETYGIVEPL